MHPELQDDPDVNRRARLQTVVILRAGPPPLHTRWEAISRLATVDDPSQAM